MANSNAWSSSKRTVAPTTASSAWGNLAGYSWDVEGSPDKLNMSDNWRLSTKYAKT